MTEQNILDWMNNQELRQLLKDTVDRMTDQGRVELLEWVKKKFPEYT